MQYTAAKNNKQKLKYKDKIKKVCIYMNTVKILNIQELIN